MNGFRFRLDPVLRVRRFELRERVATLLRARGEHASAARRAEEVRDSVRLARRAAHDAMGAGIAAAALWQQWLAGDGLEARAARAAAEAAELAGRVERARAEVIRARGRVESLERLREREARAFRSEQLRREQRVLDEIAGAAFARREARR